MSINATKWHWQLWAVIWNRPIENFILAVKFHNISITSGQVCLKLELDAFLLSWAFTQTWSDAIRCVVHIYRMNCLSYFKIGTLKMWIINTKALTFLDFSPFCHIEVIWLSEQQLLWLTESRSRLKSACITLLLTLVTMVLCHLLILSIFLWFV